MNGGQSMVCGEVAWSVTPAAARSQGLLSSLVYMGLSFSSLIAGVLTTLQSKPGNAVQWPY